MPRSIAILSDPLFNLLVIFGTVLDVFDCPPFFQRLETVLFHGSIRQRGFAIRGKLGMSKFQLSLEHVCSAVNFALLLVRPDEFFDIGTISEESGIEGSWFVHIGRDNVN